MEIFDADSFDDERISTGAADVGGIFDVSRHADFSDFVGVKIFIAVDYDAVGIFDNGRHNRLESEPAAVDDYSGVNFRRWRGIYFHGDFTFHRG